MCCRQDEMIRFYKVFITKCSIRRTVYIERHAYLREVHFFRRDIHSYLEISSDKQMEVIFFVWEVSANLLEGTLGELLRMQSVQLKDMYTLGMCHPSYNVGEITCICTCLSTQWQYQGCWPLMWFKAYRICKVSTSQRWTLEGSVQSGHVR